MRRLSGLDSTFLAAEAPSNYFSHTMAVMVLDRSTMQGSDPVALIREYVGRRIHQVPPLQRRLVQVPFGLDTPVWVDEPSVDLDRHVRGASLPPPAGPAELLAFVSELAGTQLDRRHPLWEMYVVEGPGSDELSIVAKLHHSLMDGGAGMQFMASLFALSPDAGPPPRRRHRPDENPPGDLALVAGATASMVRRPLLALRAAGGSLRVAPGVVRQIWNFRGFPDPPAAPFRAPRTLFNSPITSRRQVAMTSLPIGQVKDVAHTFGVTVNDVLLAVVAGAVRHYLTSLDELPDRELVAAVPVSLRAGRDTKAANLVSVVLCGLGTDKANPVERLAGIHNAALEAKMLQSALGSELLQWLEVPVPALISAAANLYSRLGLSAFHPPFCNLLVSDVPGPPMPLFFAGARLRSLFPLGPIFDGMGLNITAVSSADTLDVGLVACPDRLRNLGKLAGGLRFALDELIEQRQLSASLGSSRPTTQH